MKRVKVQGVPPPRTVQPHVKLQSVPPPRTVQPRVKLQSVPPPRTVYPDQIPKERKNRGVSSHEIYSAIDARRHRINAKKHVEGDSIDDKKFTTQSPPVRRGLLLSLMNRCKAARLILIFAAILTGVIVLSERTETTPLRLEFCDGHSSALGMIQGYQRFELHSEPDCCAKSKNEPSICGFERYVNNSCALFYHDGVNRCSHQNTTRRRLQAQQLLASSCVKAALPPPLLGNATNSSRRLLYSTNDSGDYITVPVYDLCNSNDVLFVQDSLHMRWCTPRDNRSRTTSWEACAQTVDADTLVTVSYGETIVKVTRSMCVDLLQSNSRSFVGTPLSCAALYIVGMQAASAWILHPDFFATNLASDMNNVFVLESAAPYLSPKLLRVDLAFAEKLVDGFCAVARGRMTVFKNADASTLSQTFVRHFGRSFTQYDGINAKVWSHRSFGSYAKFTAIGPFEYDPHSDQTYAAFEACIRYRGAHIWRPCKETIVRPDNSIAAIKVAHYNRECIHTVEEPIYQCLHLDSGENNSFRNVRTNALMHCASNEHCLATGVWYDLSIGCRAPQKRLDIDSQSLRTALDIMDTVIGMGDDAQNIPKHLHFSYHTSNMSQIHDVLRENILHTTRLHAEMHVHFMDDNECVMTPARRPDIGEHLLRWFVQAPGKYKSDVCRLVQLDETGGIYMDMDMHPLQNMHILLKDAVFATVRAYNEDFRNDIFQSFLASVPGHPLLRRTLHYFNEWVDGKRVAYDLLGPSLLAQAFEDEYGTAVQGNVKGVMLLDEAKRFNSTKEMQIEADNCNYVIVADRRVVAYSRVIRTGLDHDGRFLPCLR